MEAFGLAGCTLQEQRSLTHILKKLFQILGFIVMGVRELYFIVQNKLMTKLNAIHERRKCIQSPNTVSVSFSFFQLT